jgi:hypothetical protein
MLIQNNLFYCKNKDTYPPFKNGLYLEEFFLKKILSETPNLKRKYIPVLWTNFQIENWFNAKKNEMQNDLNKWILENPSQNGYFTLVQHDEGPILKLPINTIIFGACDGTIPIPLIYEDINHTLENLPKKEYSKKHILCSFVGNITSNHVKPNVRQEIFNKLSNKKKFKLINSGGWTSNINKNNQHIFIETTINSKFSLAPRGYGRSSFRFFECFQLGTIPIYVWNDVHWLPFKEVIDYDKLCVSIHVSELDKLETFLLSIDENRYNDMLNYYQTIKHMFTLEGMSNQIIKMLN